MAGQKSNLRTLEVTTSSGKDVKDTSMLKGEAKPSAAFRETNQTKEYSSGSSGAAGKGPLGGENTGS